ncbi:hypothetical protein E5675_17810 [Sphingopyxis sp. PAMC25046]|uniref:sulfotransferase family protein n=1 Tax=Sphingopyxis sp. PAMC25046 TaxID=2565556 RepID=UPI00109E05CE|nr:sulfotransferase [Sphingopyxis sp. PAMC25046]QCB56107.1 hypothetical protein E5675_17810 [Sphingopyxis sp. PAMC25046]
MFSRTPSTATDITPPPDEQALRKAAARSPDSAHAHAALASFLCDAGRVEEALAHADRQIQSWPSRIWPLSIKAAILSGERRAADAIDVHRILVDTAPGIPLLWANYGSDLAALGDVDEAALAFRNAIGLAPDFGPAWLGLALLPVAAASEADIAAMENGLARARDPYHKVQILFALGRGYGARGAYDRSFEKYAEANALRSTLVRHDGAGLAAFVDAHRNLEPYFSETAQAHPPASAGAIFIVGMPRSGSTLVEQILAGHPEVEAMGELLALREVATAAGAFASPDAFVRRLQTLGQAEAMQLGADYLARMGRYRRTDRPRFTDKMPANWRFVALIRRILPDARIIDVRRDPLGCCFSAYTTYFNRHTDFPNTLGELGRYYRQYLRMMDMVGSPAVGKIYRLDYARLVSDTAPEISALLDFLRLPFAAACLAPEKMRRAIYTPSAQQVRAPVRRAESRLQGYMPWLGPLQAALDAEE